MNIDSAAVCFLIVCSVALPVAGIAAVIKALRRNQKNGLSRTDPDDTFQP